MIRKEIVYILEVVRGRFPFEALKKKVMELKRRYNPSTLLIEDSPISLGLIQSLREQSINVTTYKPDTDKRARLIAQTDLFAGGCGTVGTAAERTILAGRSLFGIMPDLDAMGI